MINDVKLDYDDITIVPEPITDIESRRECYCYNEYDKLPIFASCMDTVVSENNYLCFYNRGINVVLPRTIPYAKRFLYLTEVLPLYAPSCFVAFSLDEAENLIDDDKLRLRFTISPYHICIDLANGHMTKLLSVVKELKAVYGSQMVIMTGNVANAETYRLYEEAGVDYCRASIGSGSGCLTASNTGIYYPPFSLIKEMWEIKQEINGKCKIIADGGIRGNRDIQKALIYADAVMIGGLFNKALESAAKTTYGKFYWNFRGHRILRPVKTLFNYGKEITEKDWAKARVLLKEKKADIWKVFYGMSTKEAQKAICEANGKEVKKLKTAEGLVKRQKVEYTLDGWVENETDNLRSAMSYTNSHTLEEYKNSKWVRINQIKYNK